MSKRKKVVCITVLILIAMIGVSMFFNPLLLRTQRGIHRQLLRLTPLGTSVEEVIYIADNNPNWEVGTLWEDRGILHSLVWHAYSYNSPPFPEYIGEQYVRIHLGSYYFITRVGVVAHYVFDENGELIDIFVRKHIDLL